MTENKLKNHILEATELQHELFSEGVVSRALLDAVPSPLFIINKEWRVVYANQAAVSLVSDGTEEIKTGLKVGEAFHCVHYMKGQKNTGRKPNCHVCGVARLLSSSLSGKEAVKDCRLSCDLAGAKTSLHLRVWATPLEFHGELFSILNFIDISDKYKKEMLENTCFHDLLNTLTSIRGVLSVMKEEDVQNRHEIISLLEQMTQDSIEEINTLRLIEKAEEGNLKPAFEKLNSLETANLICESLQCHPTAKEKKLIVEKSSENHLFTSDRQLLRRIVGNMVINALEASHAGSTVTIGTNRDDHGLLFWVHNDKIIPEQIQDKIFHEEVSRKGHNRGTGTYSIWLLSSLLEGEVRFVSNESEGTVFTLWLPLQQTT